MDSFPSYFIYILLHILVEKDVASCSSMHRRIGYDRVVKFYAEGALGHEMSMRMRMSIS